MANINDYLMWRGDLPISEAFPFNEIDSMILARCSYLLFDKIPFCDGDSFQVISQKMSHFSDIEFRYHGDKDLITNLGNSIRFRNMIVTDFSVKNSPKAEKQFSAITIHISEKEMYLSFIGTDSSIYGWKEDFNMAFMKNVPAQLEGVAYLKEVSSKYADKKIRMGGHSKGGNVAVYAAISAEKEIQNRMIKIDNYDGPGFDKSIVEDYKNQEVFQRVHTYIPQDSIIGRVLEHEEKFQVVQSVEKGIYQHDIYSWQVMKDDIIRLETVTNNSEFINQTLREWLKQTTPEQRKVFVDGVFELFYATEAPTVKGMTTQMIKHISNVVKTYTSISEPDRKIMNQMLKEFGKAYWVTVKHNEEIKLRKFQIKHFKTENA